MIRVAPWLVAGWWALLGLWTVIALLLNNLEATSSVQTAAIADFLPMAWSLGFCTGHWLSPRRRAHWATSLAAFILGFISALGAWMAPDSMAWLKTLFGGAGYIAGAAFWPIPPKGDPDA